MNASLPFLPREQRLGCETHRENESACTSTAHSREVKMEHRDHMLTLTLKDGGTGWLTSPSPTSLRAKFPDIREKYREIRKISCDLSRTTAELRS
jgi:hypothetical protein